MECMLIQCNVSLLASGSVISLEIIGFIDERFFQVREREGEGGGRERERERERENTQVDYLCYKVGVCVYCCHVCVSTLGKNDRL